MSTIHDDLCRALLTVSAHELFAAYNVPSADAEPVPADATGLCGVLGFTGGTLSGSVVITATDAALVASNPLGDGPSRDWIAELTNQVVGRFKNALLRRGVDVGMSVPVVLRAVRLVPVPNRSIQPVSIEVGGGLFCLWLDLEYAATFVLGEAVTMEAAGFEGDTFLF